MWTGVCCGSDASRLPALQPSKVKPCAPLRCPSCWLISTIAASSKGALQSKSMWRQVCLHSAKNVC
eukprot:356877-Chlamydomonas_euryale.AAC.7